MGVCRDEKIEFITNWETGVKTQKIEGLTTGLLDGIVTIKSGNTYLDEFIVEMVGTNKGQLLQDSKRNPLSNVIGDILRIACYRALEKLGIITYVGTCQGRITSQGVNLLCNNK